MNRRVARLVPLLAIALVTVVVPVAVARATPVDDKRAQAAQLQAQIDANGDRIAALGEQYDGAKLRLDDANRAIADAQTRYARAQQQWKAIRARLAARAAEIYMSAGSQNPLQDLDVSSVQDMMARSRYSAAMSSRDDDLLSKVSNARDQLASERKNLDASRAQAKTDVDRIASTRAQVEGANARQQQLLSRVKGELATLIAQDQQRREAQARAQAARYAAAASRPRPAPRNSPDVGPSTALPNVPTSGGVARVIAYARAQLGKPYIFNTSGPATFDCSGLTMMAWRQAGVSMPHYSGAQFSMFPHVPLDQLQPGDLVFKGPGGADHVALYVGGGMQIAATHTGSFVLLQPVQYGKLSGAVRPG